MKKYRIAIAATGEFTNGVGGGTLAGTNALINERITALNVVYENEAAIHFDLIASNNNIIFFNAVTDGLDPNDETTSANTVILNTIGANNFDIGHVFYEQPGSGGAGGVAGLGVVCSNTRKAEGWSGATSDFSLGGFMGIFLHEVGHQFNADHSYYGTDNFCNQRSAGNGYEPGSGTTLMGYSICNSHNILPQATKDYFHIHSLGQINTYANNNTCQTNVNSGNTPPVVTIPGNFTIPRGTPFELIGSATDAQDGGLTYTWEQYDTDNLDLTFPAGNPNSAATSTTAPLFRSFDPSNAGNKRIFPQLSDIINNTQTLGEILPQVSRTINMRLTVRDNHAGTTGLGNTAGGVTCESLSITVNANAGPFVVTSPNTNVTWASGSAQTVTWSVANTAGFCGNVNILLSIDGGFTFPYVLASNTPNDGSQSITVPAGVVNTTQARVRVECNNANAKFFDISNVNFTITSTCLAANSRLCPITGVVTTAGNPLLNLGTKRFFGNQVLGNRTITFDATDPTAPEASATSKGGTTCTSGGNSRYESVRFYVEQSGTYSLGTTFNGFVITSVYVADGFNINTPCANNKFVGSNGYNEGNGNQLFSPALLNLTACTEYIMVSYGSNSTETISLSGPGTIYVAAAAPSASYSYTFVAINQANGQVAAISPTANFSAPSQGTLTAGNYLVKGVSYLTTDGSTIAVGSTESAIVNSGKCLLFSTNAVPVTIQGAPSTCTITNITAGTQTACNAANNTYTQQVTVTYSNPPASGNLVVNGQSLPSRAVHKP
ncbi:MAG: hypothetical protein HC892_06585 [Saprospiraceae bacterium]|nr:hypothetical protein [Saprospiraceae bacterium]